MKISREWLTEYLGDQTPTAEQIAELLTFHAFEIDGIETVGDDAVLDVKILPDRGADCLSHRGVARELAALMDVSLSADPFVEKPAMPDTDRLKITIAAPEACHHFDLALITGVSVTESPAWLKQRLEAVGQRSINNIVDATNYVMFALGQPTHVYDAQKFAKDGQQWHFGVRFAKAGKTIDTLGGGTYELTDEMLMITNEADGAYVGLAGVKGGAYAELDATTTDIILEAGNFSPERTRRTAQRLRLQTDASKRFENGVSTNIVPYALGELVALVHKVAGGELQGYAHARPVDVENVTVPVTLTHINAVLGLSLSAETVEDIFRRLNFTVTQSAPDAWKVVAPLERTDITIAENVVEEIGRLHGYENVTAVVPESVPLAEYNQRHYYCERIREVLTAQGFSEVITSSFRKKDTIQLQNALASDKSCLRSGLMKNITEVLDKNAGFADLLGTPDTRVFEIGTVFQKVNDTVAEHTALGLGVRIRPSGYSGKEDTILADAIAALETALGAPISATLEKGVGEINVSALLATLPAVSAYEPVTPADAIVYEPFSLYPSVSRDIAVWVHAGTTAAEVEGVLAEHAGDLRVRTTLFDEFTKDDRTSLAFRMVFQSKEKTLTDTEVNACMEAVYAAVTKVGWEVR